jgi:hypothetical protein
MDEQPLRFGGTLPKGRVRLRDDCELVFIPRRSDPGRSKRILDEAMKWFGSSDGDAIPVK